MGVVKSKKQSWNHRRAHGGSLRNLRVGRKNRPISIKNPIHLVLKARRECLSGGFRIPRRFKLVHELCDRYGRRFFIKIEKMSLQGDHIHFVIRTSRRSGLQNFLRVLSGQIAQRFEKEGLVKLGFRDVLKFGNLKSVTDTCIARQKHEMKKVKMWLHRPFTRLIWGRRDYNSVQNYVQLNEKEAQGIIPYRKERLRGLKAEEWKLLWS